MAIARRSEYNAPMRNQALQKPAPISVAQLNRRAKQLLEGEFPAVWVTGEISNFSRPSSGHWYFTLKDSDAQVRCAMFRGQNSRLRFTPETGQQILLKAKLSLFEARGDYQLIVDYMEPAGSGNLAQAFEALKTKLQLEGLFDPEHKQPLPSFIQHLAVITSPTGAALHDILSVLKRRFPAIKITVLPCAVQGDSAPAQLTHAVITANQLWISGHQDFEAILLSRGGGSLEDLWAFNDENLARAIYASELPVISAVGHEVDFTMADFVADVRAPTPSAAAEMLSPDQYEWQQTLAGYQRDLLNLVNQHIGKHRQELHHFVKRLRHPGSRLQEHAQRLDDLELRLRNGWKHQLRHLKHRVDLSTLRLNRQSPAPQISALHTQVGNLDHQLRQSLRRALERLRQRLAASSHLLDSVSPLATLQRGYAIVKSKDGQVVRSSSTLSRGDKITAHLADGQLTATVVTIDNDPGR